MRELILVRENKLFRETCNSVEIVTPEEIEIGPQMVADIKLPLGISPIGMGNDPMLYCVLTNNMARKGLIMTGCEPYLGNTPEESCLDVILHNPMLIPVIIKEGDIMIEATPYLACMLKPVKESDGNITLV